MEMQMPSSAEQKKEMRKVWKEKIANLPDAYCRQADEEIFRRAVSLPEFAQAETIFCYVGTSGEINTRPILERILAEGKHLGVPRCISKGVMNVYEITSLDELEEGHYGILEPKEGCRCMEPEEIDLAFVPCITCSRDGQRLGYGGGYYDRYLEKVRGRDGVTVPDKMFVKISLCREVLLEEMIPTEEHDQRMDRVISEKAVYRLSSIENMIYSNKDTVNRRKKCYEKNGV